MMVLFLFRIKLIYEIMFEIGKFREILFSEESLIFEYSVFATNICRYFDR